MFVLTQVLERFQGLFETRFEVAVSIIKVYILLNTTENSPSNVYKHLEISLFYLLKWMGYEVVSIAHSHTIDFASLGYSLKTVYDIFKIRYDS